MKGQFLIKKDPPLIKDNIYTDKSSLVLDWILTLGFDVEFDLLQISQDRGVGLGLIRKIAKVLLSQGIIETVKRDKSKKYVLKKPRQLLENWLNYYSIKQCRMRAYSTSFPSIGKVLNALEKSDLKKNVALTLHSAAEKYKVKYTNMDTLELYLLHSQERKKIEKLLRLKPQERGYNILLIEPRYKSLLKHYSKIHAHKGLILSPILLTYLDLYHFPVCGSDQAEYMAWKLMDLNRIFKRGG